MPEGPDAHIPLTQVETFCRLCGGLTAYAFQRTIIGKYPVSFFLCRDCESLQSEKPYWLAEAYSDTVLAIDPGAAQRVLDCLGLTHVVMRLFGCKTALDYGGGAGLLCRLQRDIGHDAYWYDGYAKPAYAAGFTGSPEKHYDLVTAFEVVEHFPEPRTDWDALFCAEPSVVLIKTYLYQGQGPDWWYIAPEEGQHIFFYSPKALELIARRYGYHVLICSGFVLFSRAKPGKWQKWVLRKILTPDKLRWVRLATLALQTDAPQRDSTLLEERARQNQDRPSE
jgi:hypothetical protein